MKSIRTKILVSVLAIVIASFVVIAVTSYFQVSKHVNHVTVDLSKQITKTVAGQIDETIHGLMNRTESVASTIRVRSMDWEQARQALIDLSKAEPAFESGILADHEGQRPLTVYL